MNHFWCEIKFEDQDNVKTVIKKGFYCRQKDLEREVMMYVERLREKNLFFRNLYFDGYEVIDIA